MRMVQFALMHLQILFTWAVVLLAAIGWGAGLRRLMGRRRLTRHDLLLSAAVGLSMLLGMSLAWHLFWPMNSIAAGVLLGAGLVGAIFQGRSIVRIARLTICDRRWETLCILVISFWMANRAASPADLWDTKMYHINAVRWATQYPVVPGLANLQRNIGANNANHVLIALLNHGPWHDRTQHLSSGIFLSPLLIASVLAIGQIIRRKPRLEDLYFAPMLALVIALVVRLEMSGLSSDVPATCLGVIAAGEFLRYAGIRKARSGFFVSTMLVLLGALCCKLSTLGLAGAGGLVLLIRAIGAVGPVRAIGAILIPCLALLTPFFAHGIFLSGYPLFPTTFAGANVDWRYPEKDAAALRQWVAAYGRGLSIDQHSAGATTNNWIKPWLKDALLREIDRFVLPTALLASGVMLWLARRGKRGAIVWAVVPVIGATGLWLVSSPAFRFGFQFPWMLGAVVMTIALRGVTFRNTSPIVKTFAGISILACLVPMTHRILEGNVPMNRAISRLITGPGPDAGLHPPTPAPVEVFTTRSGFSYWVPVARNSDFCWNAPLPVSHQRNADVRLRDPSNLSKGFVMDRGDSR